MSAKETTEPPTEASAARRAASRRRSLRRLWRYVLSRRFAMLLLCACIACELVVLAVGTWRRMDALYQHKVELARLELAREEAAVMASTLEGRDGAASLGGAPESPTDADEEDPDAAPPLRARDVDVIVAMESTDTDDASTETTEADSTEDGSSAEDGKAAPEQATSAETAREDEQEADSLIRKGVAAMVAGDMRACVVALEEARTLAPSHPALLYYYGLAYDKLQNPAKAREFYNKLFRMRESAGKYFVRASRRLEHGSSGESLRGKIAFGPFRTAVESDDLGGQHVTILLPVMLTPGEEVRAEDIYIHVQCFVLRNGRKVIFSPVKPKLTWQQEQPTWEDVEENLVISLELPPPGQDPSVDASALAYYGFTAKLFYKGEPMDCMGSPSALILHEQIMNSRRSGRTRSNDSSDGLLPDDGLDFSEEALPMSELPVPL